MTYRPILAAVVLAICVATASLALAVDARQAVEMPAPMREHMLANMRDHLAALGEIQASLAGGDFGQAGDIAEHRLGMSSLQSHGATHMAGRMPRPMKDIGTAMHRAASRFARAAQEAQVQGGTQKALGALAELTQQCVACHAGFRLK